MKLRLSVLTITLDRFGGCRLERLWIVMSDNAISFGSQIQDNTKLYFMSTVIVRITSATIQ